VVHALVDSVLLRGREVNGLSQHWTLRDWAQERRLVVVAFNARKGNDHGSRSIRVTERRREVNARSAARKFQGVRDGELSGALFMRSGQL